MTLFTDFLSFERDFLKPLIARRHISVIEKPLNQLENWHFDEQGRLSSTFFAIKGVHTEFASEPEGQEQKPWDQPVYTQSPAQLALIIDEEKNLLMRAVFEPGNATRGYEGRGLILCTSCKASQGNIAKLKAEGTIPPFFSLLDDERATHLASCEAPADGARIDKQNHHDLIQAPRTVIEEAHAALEPVTRELYALVSLDLYLECYTKHALVGEHLRDLSSMMLTVHVPPLSVRGG
jgi:hypothetical protein